MEQKSLTGKTAIVTGGNSGIGLEAAKAFADMGAQVVLAVRNEEKGQAARDEIRQQTGNAAIEVMPFNLADLNSIRAFAESFKETHDSLDVLVNNAGVMAPPLSQTNDGFELQFGSNHLGHFTLTGLLLPLLKKTPGSRVVTVSSLAHRGASIDFDNLDASNGYKAMRFYGQSKLANLLFAKELDRHLKAHNLETISLACHPGISATNLFKIGKRDAPRFLKTFTSKILQPPEMGALPTIYAATNPDLQGGEYIGPDGKGYRKGYPAIEKPDMAAENTVTMERLWDVSEELTGITYDFS
ncbi:oxidoreductase [Planococcus lenghuensis]|uniref:Short-chain dehydrogenase n=1 Tax=Planococcus lenghuensis TaxID=2213202 RepID=A0A1Q2KYM0_9BACL|nr:oxidoreductase [Planococcus lenghuensis]AQQ53308.1 short-chain dehydrogenase [Planococcus lenghuensis]